MTGVATGPSSSFRPDVNGLRAVAIVAVTLYHFGVPGFYGGFVGVDVFFVISGFLMMKITREQREHGAFSLSGFYRSRFLRVMPPMLALILTLLALAYLFLEPATYLALARHGIAAALSVVDVVFYLQTDYFGPARESSWLLHLWSLSVEMQFYLVFPFLLMWAHRGARPSRLVLRLGGILAVSLLTCVALTPHDQSAAFYLLPTRIWEFLAGAVAYRISGVIPPRRRPAISATGLTLIVASIALLDARVPFPGYAAILPVAGAAMVVGATSTAWALTNPVSQLLGTVSYSLYLWHWPVWVAARHYRVDFSATNVLGLLTLSLALACASYYAIERPAGRLRHRGVGHRSALALAVGGCVAVATAGVVVLGSGFPHRAPTMVTDAAELRSLPVDIRQDACFLSPPASGDAFAPGCFDPPRPHHGENVLLWGDSHAAHLWPGFRDARTFQSLRLLQATSGACPPLSVTAFDSAWARNGLIFDPATGINIHCDAINRRVLEEMERIRPGVVVLFARWAFYDTHGTDVVGNLRGMVGALSRMTSTIIVIGPVPEWQPTLPQRAFQETFLRGGSVPERLHDSAHLAKEQLDRRMAMAVQGPRTRYVSLFKLLCTDAGCMTVVSSGGKRGLVQWDSAHLTRRGAGWIVDHAIAPAVVGSVTPKPVEREDW